MTIGEYAIVPALAKFIQAHPDTDFHIRYGNTQKLLSLLCDGFIDFAIVEGYFKGDNYQTRILQYEEYIAVSAKKHIFQKPVHTLREMCIRDSFYLCCQGFNHILLSLLF